jgi:hypothetical protein
MSMLRSLRLRRAERRGYNEAMSTSGIADVLFDDPLEEEAYWKGRQRGNLERLGLVIVR